MRDLDERHARQRQVPEVGAWGQARLSRLTVPVGTDAAGAIAAVYLGRAGVCTEPCALQGDTEFAHAACFQHPGPRNFAHGAHRALRALVLGLELEATQRPSRKRSL